ncbi:barren [Sistotremastrum suecicum HHB10207 ss-3]|uniref:Condensin complex subunit 2 n=1 Tax=Sistotremastrum suecicum HHB10207 ss-3 TaxID=1314776 RepID=A0A166CXQ9_9AGAM|nr:barren [Sistotremastrum suecicum HHB10207 ss-3]
MATRPRRARVDEPSYEDTDIDEENNSNDEQATPRPAKKKAKKHMSEIMGDSSFSAEKQPLKPIDMNDDEAERRRRRKSVKVAAAAAAAAPLEEPATPRARPGQQVNAVEPAPPVAVPLDVMNTNFEEWMKMATDNKINAANSWNFALIDYFHDMSLLRNTDDNSINFQKASSTLDGCVKIWTSRVDSVGTETGKLLSNLANEGTANDERGSDDEGGDPSEKQQRRRANRPAEATLAKSYAQLKVKKLDLEFTIDPLFKKTCADFDEGGAQGLLMNHLSLGMGHKGAMRVVFDAGDSAGADQEEEEEQELVAPDEFIDLSSLRADFLQDLDELEEKTISASLMDFSFSKDVSSFDDLTFFSATIPDDLDLGDEDFPADIGPAPSGEEAPGQFEEPQDFFSGDQAVNDDYQPTGGFDDNGSPPVGDDIGDQSMDQGYTGGASNDQPTGTAAFDPRRLPNENDVVMAMTEGDGQGGMFDYFDQTFLKNWAGPEHWKLRKVVRKASAPKNKKEKKEAFKVDFLTQSEQSLVAQQKKLFATATRGAGITLPASKSALRTKLSKKSKSKKDQEKRDDQTLPDDMHFSSKQLVTLFLKPKFSLKMRGQRAARENNGDDVDEHFWAQAAAQQANARQGDEEDENGAIPFNTQFFHDDDDAGGFDGGFDGDFPSESTPLDPTAEEEETLAATEGQGRKVRPEFVNYAKRAKRVDVRKLKENIWNSLDIVVPHPSQEDESVRADKSMDEDRPSTDPSEARVFDSVITRLNQSYPKDKMEEISTSFCFICLLHLANEQGLKLEVGDDEVAPEPMEDVEEEDRKVGSIWGLKVYRDPNATPAA